jgi:hypothetical protein
MDLLPIVNVTDSSKYLEMEIGLFQTGSSYSYAAEWLICVIPTLKRMFDYVNMLATLENIVVAFGITLLAILQRMLQLLPVWRPPYCISTYTGNTYDIEVHAIAPIFHRNMGVAF